MYYALRTTSYFVTWGTFYGCVLGILSGTAILPMVGTLFAAVWGTGIGAASGLLCGLLVAVVQANTFHPDVDMDRYRRRMMLGTGVFTAAAAAIILRVTARDLFSAWAGYYDMRLFMLFSFLALILWGGLSAAYIANTYPDWLARLKMGKRSTFIAWPSLHWPIPRMTFALARQAVNWGTIALGAVAGIIAEIFIMGGYSVDLFKMAEGLVVGIIASIVVVLFLSFGNAALHSFLRKTFFAEDIVNFSPETSRRILTGIAFVFTAVASVWTLFLAPLCALLMAFYIYRAFPLFDEDTDKAKRKEADSLVTE